jgi:hypothetical protein
MTNDEMQRKMDFIVNQQAQFSADIQHLTELNAAAIERMTMSEDRVTMAEDRMTRIEDVVLRLANVTETGFTKLEARMAELVESQAHTHQKLNALIDIVREDRNGRAKN